MSIYDRTVQFDEREGRYKSMETQVERFLDRLAELTDEARMSREFKDWLEIQSRFHRYSFSNSVLIQLQKPDASKVAGFRRWRDDFNRHVRGGEEAIWIWAPMIKNVCVECGKGLRYHDHSSCTVGDGERWVNSLSGFRPVPVFDVSQTKGEPLPELDTRAKGDAGSLVPALERAAESLGIDLEIVDAHRWEHRAKGYAMGDRARVLRRDDAATASTVVHEMAHIVAGHTGRSTLVEGEHSRSHYEIVAESVAYVVGSWLGLDMENSKFYLAAWRGDREKIKEGLESIASTSKEIIRNVEPWLT